MYRCKRLSDGPTVSRVLVQVATHTIAELSVPRAWNLLARGTYGSRQAMRHDSNREVEIDEGMAEGGTFPSLLA